MEKPQIKALVKDVLADGVIDANDLVTLKKSLADAAAKEAAVEETAVEEAAETEE